LADPFSNAYDRSVFAKHREFKAMKLLFAPMMIGMLALAGTSPAAAQSKPDQGTSVGVATTHDSTTERSSYTQKARGEMQIWQKKLHDFDAKVQVNATDAQASASKDLDDAWTETKSASGDNRASR
jgi:hypothetical protein